MEIGTWIPSKLKSVLSLLIAFFYTVILSQPVLAYRKRDPWAKADPILVSPLDMPEFLYPILGCTVLFITMVILSFIMRNKVATVLRRMGAYLAWAMGIFFIMASFPIITIGGNVTSSASGYPLIQDTRLCDISLLPFGIVLLIIAFILYRMSKKSRVIT